VIPFTDNVTAFSLKSSENKRKNPKNAEDFSQERNDSEMGGERTFLKKTQNE